MSGNRDEVQRPRAFGGRRIHFVVILDLWPDRTRSRRSRSMDHLPQQPVAPVDGVPAPTAVAQRRRCRAGQSGRIIRVAHHFTHHRGPRSGPGRMPRDLQPPPAVKIHPLTRSGTLRMIHGHRPARIIGNSLVYMVNAAVRTGKPAVFPGNADPEQPIRIRDTSGIARRVDIAGFRQRRGFGFFRKCCRRIAMNLPGKMTRQSERQTRPRGKPEKAAWNTRILPGNTTP